MLFVDVKKNVGSSLKQDYQIAHIYKYKYNQYSHGIYMLSDSPAKITIPSIYFVP